MRTMITLDYIMIVSRCEREKVGSVPYFTSSVLSMDPNKP